MKRLQIAMFVMVIAMLAMTIGLLAVMNVARNQPDSRPGRAMFNVGYDRTADKMQFLLNYQARLASRNDNRIPPLVDRFLAGRLAIATPGSDEWLAIVKFYRRIPVDRWGYLGRCSESVKKTLIAELVAGLDDEMPVVQDFEPTLLQIEFLRRDDHLGQAKLVGSDTTEARRLAARALKQWWGNGATWPENKVVNPLEGTGVAVVKR